MMKKKILSVILGSLVAYSSFSYSAVSLSDIQNLSYDSSKSGEDAQFEGKEKFRRDAQRDAALALGAQYGYKYAMDVLKREILSREKNLDILFDFNNLMKVVNDGYNELYLLPPVITEIRDVIDLSPDAKTLRTARTKWEKVKEERLVTSAPNWRQYLIYDLDTQVPEPVNVLLPKDKIEKLRWGEWIKEGWITGQAQADREMARRVNKLSDYVGMMKFKRLNFANKLTSSQVSMTVNEVSGNDNEMFIEDRIIKITDHAKFNTNADEWNAFILDNRGSLRFPIEEEK